MPVNQYTLRILFTGKQLAREINKSSVYVSQRLCGHGDWTDGDMYLIEKAVKEKKKLLEG